ncbi:MAG: kdpC [Xanthobacteraceae bacterium]|nr:kdpC [Xanthobacteraceae bacterium]
MLTHLRPALVLFGLMTVLTGIAYPLAFTGFAQVALPGPANGSLLVRDGNVVGSALIGQNFASERYFQPRPSATSAPDPADSSKTIDAPYNAGNSSGANLGPTSQKLVDRVKADVERLRGEGASVVPADAVTTSASGLDPHVSPAYAALQVARVAKARNLPEASVRILLAGQTEGAFLGVLGEPRVNVLKLNLALDALRS